MLKNKRILLENKDAFALSIIYLLFVLVPLLYAMKAEVPPLERDVNVSRGELFFERAGRSGFLTGLRQGDSELFFTCRDSLTLGNDHFCGFEMQKEELAGRYAVIEWFDQEIYPSIRQKRLVSLWVDESYIMTRESVSREMASFASTAPALLVGVFIWFVLCVWFVRAIRIRKRKV